MRYMDKVVQHHHVHQGINTDPREKNTNDQLVRSLDEKEGDMKNIQRVMILVFSILILLGIGTGYLLAQTSESNLSRTIDTKVSNNSGKVVGIQDNRLFKDSADGVLEKGGIEGEGTHKLIRDGGPSQTAYLVSSVIDLDEYIGKKVKVFGQTMTARKAPWLMDVGKIELE